MFITETKSMWTAKKDIKAMLDFSEVKSVHEADTKYEVYLCTIQRAFEQMRKEKVWSLEDAIALHEYAMNILAERYYATLFQFEKQTKSMWKFFNEI